MDFIRRRFYLLEVTIFAIWGLPLGLLFGALVGLDPQYTFLGNAASGLFMGPFLGIMFWLSWRGLARFVWNINPGWYRWVLALITWGSLPLALVLLDLNVRYIVSRYYTGDKPIPYTFPSIAGERPLK